MKIISAIVLTAFLAFVVGVYSTLPWWSFVITSLVVAVAIHQRPGKAFAAGFLGLFLLWTIIAVLKDAANEHILAIKVASILPLGGSYLILILVTGIVGGLVSGLAALTGSYLRKSK
ncbi:MAG: hypothetical protein ABIS69_07570 [Sediminibacterium sp.]